MLNQLKTVLLLGLLTALLLWIGSFWGYTGLTIAISIVLLMNVFSFWYSDKIVLKIYKAQPSKNKDLNNLVKEIALKANIPMPKVYILPTQHTNAFATGRSPKHGAVACTQGILDLLNKEELKGVLAHEISHIKNRDTLISTIAATIAGIISYVAMFARFGAIFGGMNDRDGNGLIELLVLSIVTPLMAMLIQMAISRSREYLADESAAKILHNGHGLASALEKIEQSVKHKPLKAMGKTEATSHLFISNPFRTRGLVTLFSTHPSTKERVKRLKTMMF
jgi:heat shock protein HtpX